MNSAIKGVRKMEHYQKQYKCSVCKRELIVDLTSIGTQHQNIMAITCKECAKLVNGNIMKEGEIEIPNPLTPI